MVTTWIVFAAVFFLLFVVFLFAGIIRKKVGLVIAAVIALGMGMAVGTIAFIKLSGMAIDAVADATAPRTAEEVFAAEFGRAEANCVQIIDFYDPAVVVLHDKRYICFTACPAETRRILGQRHYDASQRPTSEIADAMSDKCCRNFVTPARFGTEVWECLASEGTDAFSLYVSLDSTRVYYIRQIK